MTKGGYENLIVYQQTVVIYDLGIDFCQKYLNDYGRGLPVRRIKVDTAKIYLRSD